LANIAKGVLGIKRLFLNIIISLILCLFLSTTNSFAAEAKLAWDAPATLTDVTGYKIYYGTASGIYSQSIDVGNTTSYTVSNLTDGQTYYFATTTYNAAGVESTLSNEVSMKSTVTAAAPTPAGSGGGGRCFIATAAFGSYLEPHVKVLRDFRDRSLLTNSLGKAFVNLYYRHSPPIADAIRKHALLKYATRLALFPIIYCVQYPYLMAVLFIFPAGIVLAYKRRKTQQSH
jgi:hypothetical protein